MARPHRISRGLIGLLVVVLALGMVFYLNNVRRTRASEAPPPQAQAPQQPIAPPKPPAPLGGRARPTATPTRITPATQPATPQPRPYSLGGGVPAGTGATGAAASSASILSDARAKHDAGDLVSARKMLNDALLAGTLSPADSAAAKKMLGEINQVMILSPRHLRDDTYSSTYTVKTGELLRSIAERHEITWELLARINGISDPRKLRAGQTLKVVEGPFHAVVSKSRYTIDIYLGGTGEKGSLFVASFPVGLGANDSTPVGTWMVEPHKKLKNPTYFSPRGEGIIDADDPKNPLGERWIGLEGIDGGARGQTSYGLHGTIEPQSIGTQASMGCIRMHNQDVELVFDMLVEGKSMVVVRE